MFSGQGYERVRGMTGLMVVLVVARMVVVVRIVVMVVVVVGVWWRGEGYGLADNENVRVTP